MILLMIYTVSEYNIKNKSRDISWLYLSFLLYLVTFYLYFAEN